MDWNGVEIPIDTNSILWGGTEHKKHDLAWIGGGPKNGALIGSLSDGARSAPARIPAESILTFRLEEPVLI
jgi:hypothetical protein